MPRTLAVVAFVLVAGAASAQEYPRLKPGQWDVTISMKDHSGAPATKSTLCTDEALQREVMSMGPGMRRDLCSKSEFKRDGARWMGSSECKIGESTIKSRLVMTVTGDTAYKTDISATYDPPFMGRKDSQTTLEGKYTGPCRDGMVPGDFVGPGGQKINVRSMAPAVKPPAPPPPQTAPKPKATP
jgi:hypothetical protein